MRNGLLILRGVTFSGNTATGGLAGTGSANQTNGQGKGGALFINSGAKAIYFGAAPTYSSDAVSDAGIGTSCSSVVGAGASDDANICD